eukprot:CAMPEP_0197910666 /NCGR_PEP_ID=MMETSP1439-20131203/71323_1 /TAXON_ID=66791 /ORGANISM="Gonyaulax spinifera, Strain CCMP409" /LENGTH=331 /DNA_ID=CAMNT_0043532345 /DNA_START=30 /DNA_END=1026 /DNA_ORIENTATION=+
MWQATCDAADLRAAAGLPPALLHKPGKLWQWQLRRWEPAKQRGQTRLCLKASHEDIREEQQQGATICIEYDSTGGDADRFDTAFQCNDLDALVNLLHSEQVVDRLVEPKHPWAEDPGTIGALAAMQLALLSSMVARDDPGLKEEINNAGCIPPLVDFLRSIQDDRVQAAVVALNYLTDDCPVNAHAAYQAGALPQLIQHLCSPVAGLRGAAASTLRHLCTANEECSEDFIRRGGIKGFVNHLELVSDPLLDHSDLMLEAVWNLEDVTTDQTGNLIERNAKLANESGAQAKLERLKDVANQEVSIAAEKVLMALTQVEQEEAGSSSWDASKF